jgi:hypothetical protein
VLAVLQAAAAHKALASPGRAFQFQHWGVSQVLSTSRISKRRRWLASTCCCTVSAS